MGDFFNKTGVALFANKKFIFAFFVIMFGLAFLVSQTGLMVSLMVLSLPFLITYLWMVFANPRFGFILLLCYNFIAIGLTRYLPGIPFGLGVDFQMIVIYVSLVYNTFFHKVQWKEALTNLFLLSVIWYAYSLFQLFNPQAVSKIAWFYAMRGVSMYMLLTIPLVFIVFNKKNDLSIFLKIWAVFAILLAVKGILQKFIGPDPWEQAWLNAGGELTHVLFGKLRVFSFLSDAGQFGGAQGHSAIVFLILAYHEKNDKKLRFLYFVTGVLSLYGMMISGTRGSIAVPVAGFALYVLLSRRFKLVIMGVFAIVAMFVFFRFTTIGNSNYTIYRMRSAFNFNDPSFQVRLDNQKKLKTYMADKPFGGGIGSAGNWGMRFSPNTFLAQTPTDSWYVMIWAEQGIVGLLLHLFILMYVIIKSSIVIMYKLKNPQNIARMSALLSGMWGVMIASYANGILGQMPTGIIIYSSMAYLFLAEKQDSE
ncbi:MAG: O-antigen ligase family protein [Bacteroidales bacterium]|nr:O-antigen ligase family protein [Bacteroidales bacterium]